MLKVPFSKPNKEFLWLLSLNLEANSRATMHFFFLDDVKITSFSREFLIQFSLLISIIYMVIYMEITNYYTCNQFQAPKKQQAIKRYPKERKE